MWPRELADVGHGIPREVQRDRTGRAGQAVHLGGIVDALEDRARAAGLREDAEARARVAVAPRGRLDHERAQRASAASMSTPRPRSLAVSESCSVTSSSLPGHATSSRAEISHRSRRRPRRRAARTSRAAPRRPRPCASRERLPSSPAARACTSTLPSAVASTGPASTRRPSTSAVIWQSTRVARAAADHVDRLDAAAADLLEPLEHEPVLAGERDEDAAHELARRLRRPLARAHAGLGDAPRHVAGAQQVLVVGVEQRHVIARGLRQAQQILVAVPSAASERRDSCSSQRPMTLRSRRVVPSTPRSLERLKRCASASSTGASSSTPSSDQVPLESTAELRSRSGAATNAEAVSWAATAHTGTAEPVVRQQRAERRPRLDELAEDPRAAARGVRSARPPSARCGRRAGRSSRPP